MKRGKRAGPKRINPDTFFPAVWVAQEDGTAFLVCQKRVLRLNPVTGGTKEAVATVEWVVHGAAIRMPPEFEILLGFRICRSTWRPTNPLDFGLSKRCAQVALAEAWHGVTLTIDSVTMSAHLGCEGEKWSKYKNGVRIRNIFAAMYWDQWSREGVSIEDRATIMTLNGYPCTAAQLVKFANDRGF